MKLRAVGEQAPEFSAEAQSGERVSLADLRGKIVVVCFYPKDSTPICTKQACGFRDAFEEVSPFAIKVWQRR